MSIRVFSAGGSSSGYFDGSGVASGAITGNDTLDIQASDDAAQTLRIFGDATKYLSLSHDGTNGIVDTQSADLLLKRANVTGLTLGSSLLRIPSAFPLQWSTDTGLSRVSAAVVGVGNGTAGNVSGTVQAASVDSGAASDLTLKYNGTTKATIDSLGLNFGTGMQLRSSNGGGVFYGFKLIIRPYTTSGTELNGGNFEVVTNEAATARVDRTLPTAVSGVYRHYVVQDADGLRIVADTGDTIRVIDKVTASAGYIESTTIGSVVTLVAINATEWVATSIHGTWTDGTFTYDDTGNTTP